MKQPLWILLLTLGAAPPGPQISLNPSSLVIDAPEGGPAPAPSTLTVQNSGDGKLKWTATPSDPWLHVSPATSTLNKSESIDLAVSVDLSGLAPGTHTATIQVSDPMASNSPQTCSVTLHVNSVPRIGLSPGPISWTAPEGGPDPADQTVTIQNTGGGTLTWSASDNASWLTSSPGSGTLLSGASENVTLKVSVSGLVAGPYTGSWMVTSPNAPNSPQSLPMSLTVSKSPVIGIAPSALTFDAPQGGANPSPGTLTLSNDGGGTLSWTAAPDASWLSVSPTFGSLAAGAGQTLTVSVNTATLAEGTYLAAVHLSATGATNSPVLVNVTLNVNSQPKIGANPKALSFTASSDQGAASPAATSVTNTGSGTLTWTASPSASWLAVSPSGGSLAALASEPLLISVNTAGMTPGHYTATVDVSDPNSLNSPQTVSIDLSVTESSLPVHAPAGQCGLFGPELVVLAWILRRKRGASSC